MKAFVGSCWPSNVVAVEDRNVTKMPNTVVEAEIALRVNARMMAETGVVSAQSEVAATVKDPRLRRLKSSRTSLARISWVRAAQIQVVRRHT